MKINSDFKTKAIKGKIKIKNQEIQDKDQVILGGAKTDETILMGDKLRSMKSYGDDPFGDFVTDVIVDGVEYKARELKFRGIGAAIGGAAGIAAGTTGALLLTNAGIGGVIGAAVLGGAGGLWAGNKVAKHMAKVTWDDGETGIISGSNARDKSDFFGIKKLKYFLGIDVDDYLLVKLMKAENRNSDGREDLEFIKEYKNKDTSLKKAGDEFLNILNKVGNGESPSAREVFRITQQIENEEAKGIEEAIILDLMKAENDAEDGVENYTFLKANKPENKTMREVTDEFNSILGAAGNSDSPDVRKFFERLNKISEPEERQEEKEAIIDLIKAEGRTDHAIGNYDFLKGFQTEDKSFKEIAGEFNEILKVAGTADTTETRQFFERLDKISDPKERQEEKEAIFELIKAEGRTDHALGNYDFLKGFQTEDKSFKEIAGEFNEILKVAGTADTTETRQFFERLDKISDPKERQEEKEAIFELIKAEGRTDHALGNYDFLKGFQTEDKSFKEIAGEFNEILKVAGTADTTETRQFFERLDKISDPNERQEEKEAIFELIKAEGRTDHALGNYDFLKGFQTEDKSFKEIAGEFNEILKVAGTADTSETRQFFERLDKISDPNERQEEKEAIFELIKAEGRTDHAVGNYDFLKGFQTEDKSFKEIAGEFNEILKVAGTADTSETRQFFERLDKISDPNERQEEKEAIFELIKAEGRTDPRSRELRLFERFSDGR